MSRAHLGRAAEAGYLRSCGAQSILRWKRQHLPLLRLNQVLEERWTLPCRQTGYARLSNARSRRAQVQKWIKQACSSAAKKQARRRYEWHISALLTFDSKTSTFYTARYGIDRVYRDSKGNTRTKTTWYRTSGTYERFIDDQLVCAAARHDVKMLRGVEPYDTKASKHKAGIPLRAGLRALFAGLTGRMGDRKGIHKSDAGAGDSRQDKARVPCRPCGQTAHEHRI